MQPATPAARRTCCIAPQRLSATVNCVTRLLLPVLAALALAGCGGGSSAQETDPPSGGDAGSAVELSGKTVEGDTFSVAALRGNLVFVNVWASW